MQTYLKQVERLTKLIIEDLLKCESGEGDENKKLHFLYYSVLFKSIHSFEGCSRLIQYFHIKPFFQITFISGIRDIISDLLITEYISHKSLDTNADLEKELKLIFNEHYIHTSRIATLNKKLFGNAPNYEEVEREFFELGVELRDENGKIKREMKINSTFKRIEYIFDKSNEKVRRFLRILYMWYFLSSKVAHFGEMTLRLIAEKFSDSSTDLFKKRTKELLDTILIYCVGLLEKIRPDKNEEIGQELIKLLKMEFDA